LLGKNLVEDLVELNKLRMIQLSQLVPTQKPRQYSLELDLQVLHQLNTNSVNTALQSLCSDFVINQVFDPLPVNVFKEHNLLSCNLAAMEDLGDKIVMKNFLELLFDHLINHFFDPVKLNPLMDYRLNLV
jgi:hypothetical protein